MKRCKWCGEPSVSRGLPSARCSTCGYVTRSRNGIGVGEFGLRLVGLTRGTLTGFEGQWLEEFDPYKPGRDPVGRPMIAHVLATSDPGRALRFADASAARRQWMQWDGSVRADGRPSRSLTAFTIEVERLPA